MSKRIAFAWSRSSPQNFYFAKKTTLIPVFICCGCGARPWVLAVVVETLTIQILNQLHSEGVFFCLPRKNRRKAWFGQFKVFSPWGGARLRGFFLSSSATPEQQPLAPEIPWGETDSSIVERQLTLYSGKHSWRALLLLIHKRFYLLFFFSRNFQPIQLHSRTLYIYLFK